MPRSRVSQTVICIFHRVSETIPDKMECREFGLTVVSARGQIIILLKRLKQKQKSNIESFINREIFLKSVSRLKKVKCSCIWLYEESFSGLKKWKNEGNPAAPGVEKSRVGLGWREENLPCLKGRCGWLWKVGVWDETPAASLGLIMPQALPQELDKHHCSSSSQA